MTDFGAIARQETDELLVTFVCSTTGY